MVAKVTIEDLARVGSLYVKPLFDPETARMSVVCHPSKVDEIAGCFKQ